MSSIKRLLILVLTVALWAAALPVLAEGGEVSAGAELTEAPSAAEPEPTQEPTQPPATAPPATATRATQEPVTPPPATATPEPTQEPTPAPTAEPAGDVRLYMYVYTQGDLPASGYTVKIDDLSASTDSAGLATFSGLPVARHSVQIASPDGSQCVGQLYMSRAGSTRLTDQAMGGTYGVDVERGVRDLYMLVTFVPGEAMNIRTLSNSAPALPEPPPSEATATPTLSPQQSMKALTATFLDEEGQPLAGLGISIRADDGTTVENQTDSRGEINIPQVPYGHYTASVSSDAGGASSFELTIVPAQTTGIAQNAGTSFVVNSNTNANHLYLEFRRAGSLYTLTEASDSPIGGMSSTMLGIIAVIAIVVVIVVLIIVLRARKKKKTQYTVLPQRKLNYDPNQARSGQGEQHSEETPRKTGGANKFDDRSRL